MSADDTDASALIDKALLYDALKTRENDQSLKVINFTVKNAVDKGDNYLSDMFRVTVEFTRNGIREVKSVVVKVAPVSDGPRKEMVDNANLFPREIKMMTETLSKMNESLKRLNCNPLSAQALFTRLESPSVLVLEDLKTLDFRMANRNIGLDLAHAELALKNLARFHASSILLLEDEKFDRESYRSKIFSSGVIDTEKKWFREGYEILGEEMKNWKELDPSYSEKMIKLADTVFKRCCNLINNNDKEFKAINHCDVWTNNMMFRYNENNEPIQHIFVDFQLISYASPAMDLVYFFATSLMESVYHNHLDYLINVYHETLTNVMNRLNCRTKAPTMQELQVAIQKFKFYEMSMMFLVTPLAMAQKEDAQGIDEIMGKGEIVNRASLRNPGYKKIVINRIHLFEKIGLLDS